LKAAGSEAVEKAMAAPTKTEREKDYVAAIAAFYRDNDKLDHRTRAVAYEKAMEQVYLRYPGDREGEPEAVVGLTICASYDMRHLRVRPLKAGKDA
jgi:hypothetical protein